MNDLDLDLKTLIAIGSFAVSFIGLIVSGFNGWLGLRIRAAIGDSEARTKAYVDEKVEAARLDMDAVCRERALRRVA